MIEKSTRKVAQQAPQRSQGLRFAALFFMAKLLNEYLGSYSPGVCTPV
jgi:hypothetical protein